MSQDDGRKTHARVLRVLALAIACVLALGVAACGGGDDTSSSTSGGAANRDLAGTVTIWDYDYRLIPGQTRAVDQLDAEFERLHPGVDVKRVAQPLDNFDQLVQAAFTGRNTPDVLKLYPGRQGVLRWKKGLAPINDSVTPEMREKLDGWDTTTLDGEIYGVPIAYQGMIFYYNKKLFRRAGLPTEYQPRTWQELKATAEKLKAAGIQPFTGGDKEGYENLFWFCATWPTVNTLEEGEALGAGEIPYTDEIVARAFGPEKMMQDAGLFEEERFSIPMWPDGRTRLGQGKGAIFLGLYSGSTAAPVHNEKLGEENVGMFFPPEAKYIPVYPDHAYTIPSAAGNQDAARAYLQFMAERRSVQTQYDVAQLLPNHVDVELPADAPVQEQVLMEALRERRTGADMGALIPSSVQFGPMLSEINEYMQGRTSIEEAQQAMQEIADRTAQ